VEYITPDRPVKAMLDYAEPATTANIAFESGWTGSGVTVAVIDSGIMDTHPDLWTPSGKTRVLYANVYNPSVGADTWDRYGHGNHVSGILGGNATMSSGSAYTHTFRGIAPEVQFVNLRVLDGSGAGTDSMVIAAIQAAISLKSTYKIRIINMSLGRAVFESYTLDPLCHAVEQAWKAGIVVVVAAGNEGRNNAHATDGYGTITAPGNDPYVITVGAMNDVKTITRADDKMASYSSKGPTLFDHVVKPDIVAPGNKIIAAEPDSPVFGEQFSGKPGARELLHGERQQFPAFRILLYAERHEHGYADGFRERGVAVATNAFAHARSGQGPADADRYQDLSGIDDGDRPGDGHRLHRLLRHLHGGRGLPGHVGRAD
jgi:serine protease AprX